MSEEVVIEVKQETQGSAISDASAKIEQLKARIAELNKLEANYASKGITGTADLSKERTALQRELGTLEKTQREERKAADAGAKNDARERHKVEQAITDEERRREAVRTARGRALGRGVDAFESASGVGGLGSAGSMLASPVTAIAVAIGAYLGKSVAEAIEKQAAVAQAEGRAQYATHRRSRILGRTDPGLAEEEATGDLASNRAALEEAEARKGTFRNTSPIRDTLMGALGSETTSQKAERENQLEIDRLKNNLSGDKALAATKFLGGAGGADLEARKAGLAYDMQGKRFAEDKVAAIKEYSRIVKATGDESLAKEAAIDVVRERQRERAGNIAGLVNARTGTRGTAQLARIAAGLDDPERAGRVFAAALTPVINQAAQPPLHDWMKTGGRQ